MNFIVAEELFSKVYGIWHKEPADTLIWGLKHCILLKISFSGSRDAFQIMNFPTGETYTYQAEDSETKVGSTSVNKHVQTYFSIIM